MASEAAEYRKLIEDLASKCVNQRVSNGQPLHAGVLLETMLKRARACVSIFSGNLAPAAYDQPGVVEAASQFMQRGGAKLRILLQETQSRDSLMERSLVRSLDQIKTKARGTLEIKCAKGVYSTKKAHHFAVMDDHAYRFEVDHEKMQAFANFNEPKVAKDLLAAFDQAFSMATPTLLIPG